MRALDIDVEGRTAWAETGLTALERDRGRGRARPGDRVRRHRLGRHRRHHDRRRRRLPRPQVRPDDRRPARGRHRHRRRRARHGRRRPRSGPVLGDPRRRRQLRRRHAVQVPAAQGAVVRRRDADPARDAGDRRGLHRGGRGGARRAVDDRQRHALPADAVRARGAARQAGDPGAHRLRRRRRGGEQAMAPFRALAEPLADFVRPMPYPEMYPPEDENYHPLAVARTLFIDWVDRDEAQTIVDRLAALRRDDARRPAARPRRRDGARAGGRDGVRPSASRIMATSPRSTRARTTASRSEAWVDEFAAELDRATTAPTSTSLATRARSASAPPTPAGPGTGWRRSRRGTTREPLPAQPEHPARQARTPSWRASRRAAAPSGELEAGVAGVVGQRFERLVAGRRRTIAMTRSTPTSR